MNNDILGLAQTHQGLNHVIAPPKEGWWCVYSGKGGGGEKDNLFDRINQHFRTGTYCLALGHQRDEIKNPELWGVQVVLFNHDCECGVKLDFHPDAQILERMWRLHYGWPLLCKA